MSLNLQIMGKSLIAILDEKTILLPSSDPRYSEILKVLSEGFQEDKIKDILLFEDKSDLIKRIEIHIEEDKLLIDKIEMPDCIKNKFLELKRRHKPRSYLLKFWDKLQQNPSENSVKMLYRFLEHNGHIIMADGDFIAYKAVRMDLLDHYSKTNKHTVGRVIKMERQDVNSNPSMTCSAGLHIASWGYLQHFYPDTSRYFEVLVNPKDVVAVPNDYEGTKCRVSRYKVYREVKGERKEKLDNKFKKGDKKNA